MRSYLKVWFFFLFKLKFRLKFFRHEKQKKKQNAAMKKEMRAIETIDELRCGHWLRSIWITGL